MRWRLALLTCLTAACAADPVPPDVAGPHPVGSRTFVVVDEARAGRSIPVEVWYPAAESERARATGGEPVSAMVPDPANRTRYEDLLKVAPDGCPTKQVHSARDAEPAEGTFPLVVFSHCHTCTRFSFASTAERLASHGIAVAAADHVGNTIFESLDDHAMGLDEATLRMRVADVRLVLDRVLGSHAEVPAVLHGRFDAAKVGAFGHSFGSVTTAVVAKEDARVKAVAGVAAPMENPLFPYVVMEDIARPALFFVAREDNTIFELGNDMIRDNFDVIPAPAWKVELTDAGHFSFTDIAGIRENFMPGCGAGERMTNNEPFTYIPPATGIDVAATFITAHFKAQLLADETAISFLANPPARPGVDVTRR